MAMKVVCLIVETELYIEDFDPFWKWIQSCIARAVQ